MLTQDRALAEGLPTYMAHIRLLTSVDSLMLKEMGAPTKALPTLNAHIGSLSTGSHLVASERYTGIRSLDITAVDRGWTRAEVVCFVMTFISLQQGVPQAQCLFI